MILAVLAVLAALACAPEPAGRISRPLGGTAAPPAPAPTPPTATTPAPPELEAVGARTLPVPTAVGLPIVTGFTVDARIQPHGRPARWHVAYGTVAPDTETAPRALPGRLDAHFTEDWAAGASGWNAGFHGALAPFATGGPGGGPFVRTTDEGSAGNDTNHYEGIGLIHLGPYFYLGNYTWADAPPLYLGGGFPDLRGAELSAWLRGVGWEPRGTEIATWIQSYRDRTVVEVLPEDSRYPNQAHTGGLLTDHLASGAWERADWTLRDRTADWTFAGAYGGRLLYDYGELDAGLSGVNVDLFLWQVLFCDLNDLPSGSIDTADFSMTYRQHSLLAASNGARLIDDDGTDGAPLTDGWRFGDGREWRARGPRTLEWAFGSPVSVASLNLVNATVDPAREVAISASSDGWATWTVLLEGEVPAGHELGPNFAFLHEDAWVLDADGVAIWAPLHEGTVDRLRLEVRSCWQGDRCGLGEVEAFGAGAVEATDDAWYDLNADVRVPPGDYVFRVVAESDAGRAVGELQRVTVPAPPG